MGKSGGAKVQVIEYYMSQHFGICTTVDAMRKITIKEKEAWSGYLTERTKFAIQDDSLFGGATKEGGATGTIYFLPGRSDQLLYDELATRLGRSGGDDAPGYRGLASIFFTGRPDANKGARGFYWAANSPYLPGVWVEVRRAPVGLTAAYAMIARSDSDFFPYEQATTAMSSSGGFAFSGDHQWMIRWDTNGYMEWWDAKARTNLGVHGLDGGPGPFAGSVTNVALAKDGTAFFIGTKTVGVGTETDLYTVTPTGVASHVAVADHWFSGPTRAFDLANGTRRTFCGVTDGGGYYEGSDFVAATNASRDFCLDDADEIWTLAEPTGSSSALQIRNLDSAESFTITGTARGSVDTAYMCYVSSERHFFIVDSAGWFTVDRDTGIVKDSGAQSWSLNNFNTGALQQSAGSSRTFWSNFTEISLATGAIVRSLTATNWLTESSGSNAYDPVNHAIVVRSSPPAHLTWYLLDRGELDANPAHIIYECLTNTDWGMGSPSSLIDVDSFEDAGVALFDEPLGVSMIWTRQATIESFIQEVLDHVQAVLFVDPQTGLLTLKLIRDDYDVGTLPAIDPSSANLTNFGRKLWGEIVNEITVTWTNPDNEQDETVTAHDLASITTQGGIVSDSRNYYGVRYAALAQRLAARDLRSAGAPLATCEAEVDRSLWALRPASVLLLDWPEYGLDGVVMRVTSIDYGKPGDPSIKLALIEDVFGLDAGDYVTPPTSAWEDPSSPPEAMDEQAALTLPYYFAANGITSIVGATFPEVFAGALGATSNTDASLYELWGEVTLADGSLEWQSLATLNVVGRAELTADLDAEASSSGVTFSAFVGSLLPEDGGFALIGGGTEEENEVALISGAASPYVLSRGMLDTVPRAWPAGTPVWFIAQDTLIEDPTTRSAAEIVNYRLRMRTSQGLLTLYAAPLLTYTLTERPWLPSRPANVVAYGDAFSSSTDVTDARARPHAWITVTWSNRNRLTEDNMVLDWTDSTVTPETGQTTTIEVLNSDGATILATHGGLTGTTFDVPDASFGSEAIVILRTSAERTDADGTFRSLQSFDHWVSVAFSGGAEAAGGAGAFAGAGASIANGAFGGSGSGAYAGGTTGITGAALSASGAGGTALVPLYDPSFSGVVLLCGFEGANNSTSFIDERPSPHTLTANGNAKITTANFKYGASSAVFDGAGDFISALDSADWNFGTGQFTVEGFFRFLVKQDSQAMIGQWDDAGLTSNDAWFFYISGGNLRMRINDFTFGLIDCQVAWAPTLGTWYHLAYDRDGTKGRIYRDGAMVASSTAQNGTILNSTAKLTLGALGTTGAFSAFDFNGNMDEVRVTKGVARYASDGGFTVPASAYPRS